MARVCGLTGYKWDHDNVAINLADSPSDNTLPIAMSSAARHSEDVSKWRVIVASHRAAPAVLLDGETSEWSIRS